MQQLKYKLFLYFSVYRYESLYDGDTLWEMRR